MGRTSCGRRDLLPDIRGGSPMTSMLVHRWTVATVVLMSAATFAWAQETSKPALTSNFQKIEATVEAINPATREVTLKGPQGKEVRRPESPLHQPLPIGATLESPASVSAAQ